MKYVREPSSFTVKGNRFIIYYGGVKLIFPKELYTEHFEEWKSLHGWIDQSRIEFEMEISEL